MKAKRIIASFLSGVFSLSMMHVNVGAQNSAEKVPVKEESIVVVAKEEETTKESTAKKFLLKIANGATILATGTTTLSLLGIKKTLNLIKTGVEYVAIGFCMMIGANIYIKISRYYFRSNMNNNVH